MFTRLTLKHKKKVKVLWVTPEKVKGMRKEQSNSHLKNFFRDLFNYGM